MSTKKLIKALGLIIVVALLAAALPLQAKAQEEPPQTLNVAQWTGPTKTGITGRETVLKVDGTYHMWYSSSDETKLTHAFSEKPDFSDAKKEHCTFEGGAPLGVGSVSVIKDGGSFFMIAYGADEQEFAIYKSSDGNRWGYSNKVLDLFDTEITKIDGPYLFKDDATYRLFFQGKIKGEIYAIFEAKSANIDGPYTFTPEPVLLSVDPNEWDGGFVMHPWVVKADKTYYLWYSAHNGTDPQRIGMAKSEDGINWVKSPGNPIFDPATGYAEPSVITDGETWQMWTMGTGGVINYLTATGPFEFQSIQAAIDAASTGDTIFIHAGTYVENPVLNATLNPNKQLNFIGKVDDEGKPLPLIKGTLNIDLPFADNNWSIENIKFEVTSSNHTLNLKNVNGLTIRNCEFDGAELFASGKNGINIESGPNGNNLTVEDSVFKNGLYVGINGYVNSLAVINCSFDEVKSGVNIQGAGGNTVTVEDSNFSVIAQGATNDTYGVRFASSGANTGGNLTITNSSFVVNKNGFVAGSGTYHSAIIIRAGATGALKVENSSILGEVVNQATSNTLDASPNWWGSALGPQFPIEGDVQIAKWCADADCLTFLPDDNGDVPISGDPFTQTGAIKLYVDGVNYYLPAGTTIQNSSPCFEVYADDIKIYTDYPAAAKCVPTDASDGIWVADAVENLRVINLEFDGTGQTTGSGIFFSGDAVGFQVVDNYFHDLGASGVVFTGTPSGSTMDIQGNMFQDLGATAIVVPTGLDPDLNAEYNSWGVYAGAMLTDVDTEPHTHADFYMEYEGIIPLEKVAVGNTIKYTVYGNLQNISGAQFTLKFPTGILDAGTPTNLSSFVPAGTVPLFVVDETAGTITFNGYAATAVTGQNVPIYEVVFTGTAAGTGAINFDQTNDAFAMFPGYGPSTWVYAAGYVDRTVEVFVDSDAPTLTSWTPAEGNIYLAQGEDFVLTVDASDDNLFSLEIDHSLESVLPEFSVYADEADPYGGDESDFEAAGLVVTYDETTQTWVLTFENGGAALNTIIANHGITFYAVLHDQAGKTWGSMDPTTEDNTFAYSIVFDNTAPALESWTPAKDMTYMLTPSGDFVLTVDAMDVNLFGLELDHSLEGVLPEFWVYADADPYGGEVDGFTAAGLAVTYNATTQTWTLTFENGGAALDAIIANQGITFYAVIHDLAGNKWGSMYDVEEFNTFAYTLYQQQPIARADSTGGAVVAVVSADGNTIDFTGEVDWYPADPDLGRTSGHRIGVRLSAPELDFDTTLASFTFNGQIYNWKDVDDGDDYVLVYPKVTAPIQTWEIVVTWGGGFSQTFTVNFDGTLGPVTAYTVDGEISMQGRVARNTEDVITLDGYMMDDFTADSLDKLGINYTLSDVLTGEYTIVTNQPRYLNITADLGKSITLISNRTLPPLELKAGDANDDHAINAGDASIVGAQYGTGTIVSQGDINFDNAVNIQDLALVGGNYGLTPTTAYSTWTP